jgi:alanyl aminopeptidase
MTLDPRRDGFSGQVEIDLVLDHSDNHVWIHGKGLKVASVSAALPSGQMISGSYLETVEPGVSLLSFESEIPAGTATVRIEYQGQYDRNLAGLFKVEEQGDAYVLAKSESIQARAYLPGFDEPGLKATFDIQLTIPADNEAITNTPVLKQLDVGDGMKQITFATTPPMSTYLLSLAVGPFDIVERGAIPPNSVRPHSVPLRGIARKGRGGDMNFVLDATPRMLEIFEQDLQQPYPYRKLDIVAAPAWPSGATELSAAITYREQRILVGDNPAPGARLALLSVHAHELAHMWFGNLVTPPWWDDLWLKEGFASWSEAPVLSQFDPDGSYDQIAIGDAIYAMKLDSLASTRAIREPIDDNDEIRNAYDSITYAKSVGVIHMIDQYFGSDVFRPALGRYIAEFADGVADSPDFYDYIAEATETPALTETFRGFVEQTGVPLVELSCQSGAPASLSIRQSRYKAIGSPIQDDDKLWNIPVCVRSDTGSQCEMMTKSSQTVPLTGAECPGWIMPNAGGSGYYRWTLDDRGWRAVADNFSQLSPTEAMSVVDSAFAAFEAGGLAADVLWQVIAASSKRTERLVVRAPLPYLSKYVDSYFSDADRARFAELASQLYGPVLERTRDSLDGDQQLLHGQLKSFMALTAGDEEARKQLFDLGMTLTGYGVAQNVDAVPSDYYDAALTVAVQDADDAFLPHLLELRGELDNPLFEKSSAAAIGHFRNPEQLDLFRNLVLAENTDPRDVSSLLSSALLEPALQEEHWQWAQQNFPAIVERLPSQSRRFTPYIARGFCSEAKLSELESLFTTHGELTPGYERNLDQVREGMNLCIAQRDIARSFAATMKSNPER